MAVVGGVCHPDNVHFGLVAGVKLRCLFIKEGFLSAAVVEMGMCLMQEGLPKDKPSALDCVGHDEFHISDCSQRALVEQLPRGLPSPQGRCSARSI